MGCVTGSNNGQPLKLDELDEELENEINGKRMDKTGKQVDKTERDEKRPDDDLFEIQDDEQVEQFMAVKPWIGALIPPSNPSKVNNQAPDQNLELEFINGYCCEDSRQNLFYVNENSIAYYAASVGIILDQQTQTQTFLGGGERQKAKGHTDDITACSINQKRTIFVTGQRGNRVLVCAWDLSTGQLIKSIELPRGSKQVKALGISNDDQYIFATTMDTNHSTYVYSLTGGKQLGVEKLGGDPIFDLAVGKGGSYAFAVCGTRQSNFLFQFDGTLTKKKMLYGGNQMVSLTSIVCFENDDFLCGSVNGSIYRFKGLKCDKTFNAHKGAIHAITTTDDKIISCGGGDSQVIIWDRLFKKLQAFTLTSSFGKAVDMLGNKIIVGTRDGRITEFILGNNSESKEYINGHGDGEAWGLDYNSSTKHYFTSGDDNKIIVFDSQSRKTIATAVINEKAGSMPGRAKGASTLGKYPPNQCSRAIAVNSQNGHIAIGINDGSLQIREGENNLKIIIAQNQDAKEWIECMAYSPCYQLLAVGSHDNCVRVYSVNNNYKLLATLRSNTSFITSLDWSCDSSCIQTNSGSYELLFFDSQTGKQLTSGATQLRDEKWNTYTCKLGWPVQGVFPPYTDGTHVNGIDRSKSEAIFATGDDWGLVNLYRNPSLKGSQPKSYRAHSSHVVRVKFNENDTYLFSIGGYDKASIQWKLN